MFSFYLCYIDLDYKILLLTYFSTISSGLNSLAAVTLTDIIRPRAPDMTEKTATNISKITGIDVTLLLFIYTIYNYKANSFRYCQSESIKTYSAFLFRNKI